MNTWAWKATAEAGAERTSCSNNLQGTKYQEWNTNDILMLTIDTFTAQGQCKMILRNHRRKELVFTYPKPAEHGKMERRAPRYILYW